MASIRPRAAMAAAYEESAREYIKALPMEHFMEALPQATQRKITLESLDLLRSRRSDFQVFNELLVQYEVAGQRKPGQVVPDNMVVLSDKPVQSETCFNTPLEPVGPFWMMEYVSKNNKRKDYEDNFDKYEYALKVPYYLTFYPDNQELSLYKHNGKKYVSVKPNKHGRLALPELDLEIALHGGWIRFWYQGDLLPLPADLQRELDQTKRELEMANRRAEEAIRQAERSALRIAELERLLDAEKSRRTGSETKSSNGSKSK